MNEKNGRDNAIISTVFCAKAVIASVITPLPLIFAIKLSDFQAIPALLVAALVFAEIFSCSWIFIAKSKVYISARVVCLIRLASVLPIYAFVNDDRDLVIYLAIHTLTALTITSLQVFFAKRELGFCFVRVSVIDIAQCIKQSFKLFASRFGAALKDRFLVAYLGFAGNVEITAVMDIINKMIALALAPAYALTTTVFPVLVDARNRGDDSSRSRIGFMLLGFIGSLALSGFVWGVASMIMTFFGGDQLSAYSHVLKITTIAYPILFLSSYVGSCILLVAGKELAFMISTYVSLIVMAFGLLIYELSGLDSAHMLAMLIVSVAFTELFSRVVAARSVLDV